MKNAEDRMSVSKKSTVLLCLGFCFFVNPIPLGLDFIPDAFGCILIYFGLTQLAYFDGQIEQAKKSILYLLIVEAVNLLLMKSIFTTEISTNRMLGVTVFSILQGILYIMFFRTFFGGLNYYAMRNNCNETLKKCDGTAFMSYLAFFVRIASTLLPELLALIELELYVQTDFDVIDSINDLIVSAKPVLVALLSLVSLITNIAWLISMTKLLRNFKKEGGNELDERYYSAYTSRPEMTRPKKLRTGSYIIYLALAFSLDIVFDGIRIIPFSVMFLILYIGAWFFKDLCDFKLTKRFAVPSFVFILGSEIYRRFLTPNGAITIYETDFWIVAVAAAIALIGITFCFLCVRGFLSDLKELQKNLGGKEIPTNGAWISFCVLAVLWAAGFIVPYFYSYVSTLRLFAAGIFIWQTAKVIVQINDEEFERFVLYDKK